MIHAIQVLGGMALFLFGVGMLSDGMEKLAGERIQQWLDRMTNRPLKGAAFGMVATALTQSSSLLMVTMIGLINANLMTLEQAVGVMMGQEIGTTLTAQIVAFKIGELCYLFMIVGFALIEFAPRDGWEQYGEIILGVGLLFLGMNLMSDALKVLTQSPQVSGWLAAMGQNRLAGVLAGIVATAVIQSSSAVTGLLVAMGISGAITLPGAIAILLGANIGTCVTGFIASLRLSRASRRASVAQILINVAGVVVFLPFITPFTALVERTSHLLPRQIANAHSIFNVTVSAALLPLVRQIARLVEGLVPERRTPELPKPTAYIDERQFPIPQVALQEAFRELDRLGITTAEMLVASRRALLEQDLASAEWVLHQEQRLVDPVSRSMEEFVNRLLQQGKLSPRQQQRCFQIKNLVTDVERIGDLTQNLAEAAQLRSERAIAFSSDASEALDRLFAHAHTTYTCALDALRNHDRDLGAQVCSMENEFDALYLQARQGHIDRLAAGVCHAEADVLYVETLRNLERISDHADNLGISVNRS